MPQADHPKWIRYDNDCEKKWAFESYEDMPQYWKQLMVALTASRVTDRIGQLIGEPQLRPDGGWRGGGLHLMFGGGHLQTHVDYALHPSGLERRANLILFLTDDCGGGALELVSPDGVHTARVFPEAGLAVAWECNDFAFHGVQALTPDSPPRLTAAAYFLAPARPNTTRRRALFVPRRVA